MKANETAGESDSPSAGSDSVLDGSEHSPSNPDAEDSCTPLDCAPSPSSARFHKLVSRVFLASLLDAWLIALGLVVCASRSPG